MMTYATRFMPQLLPFRSISLLVIHLQKEVADGPRVVTLPCTRGNWMKLMACGFHRLSPSQRGDLSKELADEKSLPPSLPFYMTLSNNKNK